MKGLWLDSRLRKSKPLDSVLGYYVDKKSCVYASKTFSKGMRIFVNDYWDDVYDVLSLYLEKFKGGYVGFTAFHKEMLLGLFDSVCVVGDLVCEVIGESSIIGKWRGKCKSYDSDFFSRVRVTDLDKDWFIKFLTVFVEDLEGWMLKFQEAIDNLIMVSDGRSKVGRERREQLEFCKKLIEHKKEYIKIFDRGISKIHYSKFLNTQVKQHYDEIQEQIKKLKHPNKNVRYNAIDCLETLARKGLFKDAGPIVEMLKDDNGTVRYRAIICLELLAEKELFKDTGPIVETLKDADLDVRYRAIFCLETLAVKGLFKDFNSIVGMLKDEDDSVRVTAVVVLRELAKMKLVSYNILGFEGAMLELCKSNINNPFLENIYSLLQKHHFELIYRAGYFNLTLKEQEKIIILDINIKENCFVFQESLQENNIIINLKFKFNFKPQIILEIGGKMITGEACKIITGSTAQTTTELTEKGKVQRQTSSDPYERIITITLELNNKGHAWAALVGHAYNQLKNKKLTPLAIKSLAWYYWHYSITGEIPNEKELDSYPDMIQTLKQQKTNITPQNILNEIAQNYEKINKKQEQKIREKIEQDLESNYL